MTNAEVPAAGSPWRQGCHRAVALTTGFLVLTLEFAAVRLFAPTFGQSSYVWGTVIGLLLLALAAGYAVGGRLGDRSRSARPLYLAHGLAAGWTLAVAAVGQDVCSALLPDGLPGEGVLPLAFTGSLLATIVLFAVPVFLLGMTSPFLIRLDARQGTTGRTAGSIYACGTIGSLAACYVAPLYLLQDVGTRGTLWISASVAASLAIVGLLVDRRNAPGTDVGETPAGSNVPRVVAGAAFTLGLSVTVIEFTAVRFMSPWLGQSNPIWANVIGVMMLAIALGSWLGGRVADRSNRLLPDLRLAAGWLVLVAVSGTALLGWLVPESLTSLGILPAAWWASIVATVLFFAVPVLVLSMAIPSLVRTASQDEATGHAAGRVLAWNTAGGILGCLLTPVVLVPGLGSRTTLLLTAGVLAGLWGLAVPRARRQRRLIVAGLGVLVVLVVLWQRPLRTDPGQLAEVESSYQTIRVVESARAPWILPTPYPASAYPRGRGPMRYLRHDEDAETFQSSLLLPPKGGSIDVWNPVTRAYAPGDLPTGTGNALLTAGQYFEHMALGAQFVRREQGTNLRVLIIGYAGGTVHRVLRETLPDGYGLDLLGIEIDPGVIRVARRWLDHDALESAYTVEGSTERFRLVTGEDARTVVNALPVSEVFDIVLVDAYARTNYLPFQLASQEFFEKVKRHLAPDGWIGVNVLGSGTRSPVAKSVARTMTAAVGPTFMAPNPTYPGNVILWTSPNAISGPRIVAGDVAEALARRAAYCIERLLLRYDPALETDPRVVVLTDDRSPSDRLADQELGL